MYRESICKDFLRLFIPMRLDIGNGFLINTADEISTQCDIVIYDRNNTPLIENNERQRFFPVETVSAIGEIKSNLDREDLKLALNKLARNKKLRDSIDSPKVIKRTHDGRFDPENYCYDSMFSFLICNKLNFSIEKLVNEIDSFYEADIKPWHKHNLILSVEDGLLAYVDSNKKTFMYPNLTKEVFKNRFLKHTNSNIHFYVACSYIFMGTTSNSIYYPDMISYLKGYAVDGVNTDQQ